MNKNSQMEYRGYSTKPEYSKEDGCFFGTIFGINDTVVFGGESVPELEQAFHEAVDGYLDLCERHNKTPDREYSGHFNVRIEPELHRRLATVSDAQNMSLNTIVSYACKHYLTD